MLTELLNDQLLVTDLPRKGCAKHYGSKQAVTALIKDKIYPYFKIRHSPASSQDRE